LFEEPVFFLLSISQLLTVYLRWHKHLPDCVPVSLCLLLTRNFQSCYICVVSVWTCID